MDRSDSLSADDAMENGITFLHKLNNDRLIELRNVFKQNTQGVNKTEFVNGLERIFDVEFSTNVEKPNKKIIPKHISRKAKYIPADECINVFKKIYKEDNEGRLSWVQFLDFLDACFKPKQIQTLDIGKIEYILPPHVKKDPIIKIVLIETDNYFCYCIISKYGRVGLYDGNFNFLTSYSVIMLREDIRRNDEERRRRNRWITDVVFMQDVFMLVVASTTRNLTIYDAAALKHVPLWLILGFHDIIQSMAYKPPQENKKRKLILGSDFGKLSAIIFQKPKDNLFRKKHNDKLSIFFYQEIIEEKEYTLIKKIGNTHGESVKIIEHINNDHVIISCSRDAQKSVVIGDVDGISAQYIFKMRRGTNCFAISYLLKILITGSDDGALRIWNSVVTSKPLSVLNDHGCGVIDIVIFEHQNMFFSCSRDGVLKIWDLKEQKCLQSILLKFPPFEIQGKRIEWGYRNIYPGPKRQTENKRTNVWERSCILLSCCNYYAKIDLNFMDGIERDFEAAVLPPPPLQNSFLIPKDWKICEETKSHDHDEKSIININDLNLESVKFILEKDILGEMGCKSDINYKIAMVESKKLQMQWAVEHCAPYLALDLYEIKEITLSPDLAVPNSKRVRSLVDKTQKMLADATARSIIFSDTSTSSKSPRSSRSSIVEFDL